MSQPVIAGNWKMNTTIREAQELARALKSGLEAIGGVEVVLCVPFVSLSTVAEVYEGSSVALGAQNMHYETSGAFTGEVSPAMLAGLCQFVIVGHSERRMLFGETDEAVGRKVAVAQRFDLRPIMCVGETQKEREEGRAEVVVEQQVRKGLAGVERPGDMLIAYEPVWAIGTGRAVAPSHAQDMLAHIRALLADRFGREAASRVRLLYGGSVTDENVAEFVRQNDVDGALVGGASLKSDVFVKLVRKAAEAGRKGHDE